MFEFEGDKIAAERVRKNLRNAEELKRQIAEKKHPVESKIAMQGNNVPRRAPRNYDPESARREKNDKKEIYHQAPFATNTPVESPRRVQKKVYKDNEKIYIPQEQAGSKLVFHEYGDNQPFQIPDFHPNVPFLNLNIGGQTDYSLAPIPVPKIYNSLQSQIKSIEAKKIESDVLAQSLNKLLNQCTEKTIPLVGSKITNLGSDLDKLMAIDIPIQIKSRYEMMLNNEYQLNTNSSNMQKNLLNLTDEWTNFSNLYSQFDTFMNEFNITSKSTLIELIADKNRLGDKRDQIATRLYDIENHGVDILEESHRMRNDAQLLTNQLTNDYSQLEQSINSVINTTSDEMTSQINGETHLMQHTGQQLSSLTEELNRKISATSTDLTSTISNLSVSLQEAFKALSSTLTEALDQTQNENQAYAEEISKTLTTLVGETEANFKALESETINTIKDIKDNTEELNLIITSAIETENNIRAQNQESALTKFKDFKALIDFECQLQADHLTELNEKRNELVDKFLKESFNVHTDDWHNLFRQNEMINETESKLDDLEFSLLKFEESISSGTKIIEQSIADTISSLSEVNMFIDSNFSIIEERLSKLSVSRNPNDQASKTELVALSSVYGSTNAEKIARAEEKLKQIKYILSHFIRKSKIPMKKNSITPKMVYKSTTYKIPNSITPHPSKKPIVPPPKQSEVKQAPRKVVGQICSSQVIDRAPLDYVDPEDISELL